MRQARTIKPGARYHVIARANDSEFILKRDEVKKMLRTIVVRAKGKFDFSLIKLKLVDNQVHFVIQPGPGENLSKIMQWILSVFAIQYNNRNNCKGHVWYDRFKSVVIE